MARFTPSIDTSGRFTVKLPWQVNDTMTYRVIAVKSFDDLAKLNKDVYNTIYKPMGLIDGQDGFSWSNEVAQNPNIISLLDPTGTALYIPDTYILSYPDASDQRYSYIVLGVDLGALPDSDNLTTLKADIADFVKARIGTTATVSEHRIPSTSTPTKVQHAAFLAARENNITETDTLTEQVIKLKQELATLRATNASLTKLAVDHDLIS